MGTDLTGVSTRASGKQRVAFAPAVRRSLVEDGRAVFDGDQIAMDQRLQMQLRALRMQFEALPYQTPGNDLSEHFFDARRSSVGHLRLPADPPSELDDASAFVQALAEATLRILPGLDPERPCSVSWMLARHTSNIKAMPVHRDNVDWVAEFNVSRTSGAFGGAIQIIDADDEVVASKVLERPMDGYIIDDARYQHGVTPMTMASEAEHRDVLIVRIRADVDA